MKHHFFSLRSLLRLFRAFARSESGMTLPLLAVSMVAMAGMTGMAIDTARMQLVQSKLQFSLDAAGLAAGSTVSTSSLNSEVTKYLNTNFNGYLGATITGTNASVDETNTIITLSASAQMPSTFMNVVGIQTLTVHANSQISRAVTGLELILVLDNTGSMANSAGGGVSKISALRTAATTLVNSLFASGTGNGKLWVGLVPFSQAVNIGTSHPTWMDATYDATITDWGPSPSAWAGCVDARKNNSEDVIDDPPSQGSLNTLFHQYYWISDNLNPDGVSNGGNNIWKSHQYNKCVTTYNRCKNGTCTQSSPTCSTSNGHTCTLIAPTCTVVSNCNANSSTTCTDAGYTYSSPLDQTHQGPNYLCPQEVVPMTNVSSTLTTAIGSMQPQGNTVINQGLFWGWNMISPRWQGMWGGTMDSNGLPLAYGSPGMNKAIVLLTDGENTDDNSSHGAYWFVGDDWLGTTNSNSAITELNNRTLQLCTAMKSHGIYIYTIALGTDVTAGSLALLQSCATAQNYFFNSPNTTQLQGIFSQISDSLANLRVSK